tara:strand:+ start:11286 stop:12068 length:783 start_codon:yes stop_codon:yes gene_type:complete
MKNIAFIFDLDKTIGYFTQIAIFMEAIEDFIKRPLKIKEFFNLLDTFPKIFRPDAFSIFNYLKELKKKHNYVKVLIYTNNMGPKSWVHNIRKYIEHKINYKLFDRTIAAWKVGKEVYEKCRTSHGKSVNDIINCSLIKKGDKICFLDDQRHDQMIHKNVDYLFLYPYKFDYEFEKMISKFLSSSLKTLIKKEKHHEFKKKIMTFSKHSPYGYRYIERTAKNPQNYDRKEILKYLKLFFKTNKKYTRTKRNKKQRKTKKKK